MKLDLKINNERARDTGMAMVLILLLLELFLGSGTYYKLAIPTLVINMIIPRVFYPFAYLWFGFAHIMGTIMSKILLFLVFIIMVIPVGVIRKIIGRDNLKLKNWKKSSDSVFINRDHLYTANDIEKPY